MWTGWRATRWSYSPLAQEHPKGELSWLGNAIGVGLVIVRSANLGRSLPTGVTAGQTKTGLGGTVLDSIQLESEQLISAKPVPAYESECRSIKIYRNAKRVGILLRRQN